jgi:L,D-transpeptidase ErfK/SrfK
MKTHGSIVLSLIALAAMVPLPSLAAQYVLPAAPNTVIGELHSVDAAYEDTLLDIGRRNEEIIAANPGVDPWIPGAGTHILIPSLYVLPDVPREGIVVNLPEHRLYYFPKPQPGQPAVVVTYPVSVGKMDWKTPLGVTHVADKRVRPTWYPPESVRQEHEADGRPLPKAVPPGPDNPLGEYAMRLAIPGGAYLIHGTNLPAGVGMQITHGCIRMYPEDIEKFFQTIAVGTPVRILHQPYKMGWQGDTLYMEVHTPLLDQQDGSDAQSLTSITRMLVAATRDRATVPIDWAGAERVFHSATGVPEPMMLNAGAQLIEK